MEMTKKWLKIVGKRPFVSLLLFETPSTIHTAGNHLAVFIDFFFYFLQDPLIEFSQLCGAEKDILCLRYHPLQDLLSEDELLDGNIFFDIFVPVGFYFPIICTNWHLIFL